MKKPPRRKPANGKPRRARPTVTTRSTAGPGYDFEDRVAAWIMVGMLRGAPVLGAIIFAREIRWQTGRPIDDLAIVGADTQGSGHAFALSCKSSVQVTAKGLPEGFVAPAWQHWQSEGSSGCAHVVLVTRDDHHAFNALWSDIKGWCAEGPSSAISRIEGSKKHAQIFALITQAVHTIDHDATQEALIGFIRAIEVLPFDFQLVPSKDEAEALASCRAALVSEEAKEAQELWDALLGLAKSKRHPGGELDAGGLIAALRPRFSLKGHPDFSASWTALRVRSRQRSDEIETTLPSRIAVDRVVERDKLLASVARSSLTLVHGESGVGKSALVLSSLQPVYGDDGIVWLRGNDLDLPIDQAERGALGIAHTLPEVLDATRRASNLLVIDSAERMSDSGIKFLKGIMDRWWGDGPSETGAAWRAVLVAQSSALEALTAFRPYVATADDLLEVGVIPAERVRETLRAHTGLGWLASDVDAVDVLGNLKTLAWVCQAEQSFKNEAGQAASRVSVAKRLWQHWTQGRTVLQQVMIAMAEREANFAPLMTRSQLDPAQAKEFDDLPSSCPIRMTPRGKLEFKHDLASDWSRFQRLQEIADRPLEWAQLASNPLWRPAIQMLGQELLRERAKQGTAWDEAFQRLEKEPALHGAAGLLLDALCLDPLADDWMQERTALLLANDGKRLEWMLERFHHHATVPTLVAEQNDHSLSFYMEAMFRTPIYARWGPVVRFLHRHRAHVAPLGSSAVAKICETWLKSTPVLLSGQPTYHRRELAEVALASARELQFELLKDSWSYDKGEEAIYAAAFAAAPDLPDEVSAWALEMAQRKPVQDDLRARKTEYEREKERKHQERMKGDQAYREQHTQRRQRSGIGFLEPRRLPHWPMGAKGRVSSEFQRSCCHRGVLAAMMKVRPDVTAEILLAVMIDDEPREERSDVYARAYGLAFDQQSDPAIYWKSAFYQFLHIAPEVALATLKNLIIFCTDRWREVVTRRASEGTEPPHIVVKLTDGGHVKLYGNQHVYAWSYETNMRMGHLTAALHALERWLWERCTARQDIGTTVNALLEQCSSVAIVGVLINVGKAHPHVIEGPIEKLLTLPEVHFWDYNERQVLAFRFAPYRWWQSGEEIFQMARQWLLAPWRSKPLGEITLERQRGDAAFAQEMQAALRGWIAAHADMGDNERAFLIALDATNYEQQANGSFVLKSPEVTPEQEAGVQSEADPLALAEYLGRHFLGQGGMLSNDQAVQISEMLRAIEADTRREASEKRAAATALAAILSVKAEAWLDEHQQLRISCRGLLEAALTDTDATIGGSRRMRFGRSAAFDFAGNAIISCWLRTPDDEVWSALLIRFMTSMNEGAVGTVVGTAFQYRERLGAKWGRLLDIAALWSALLALRPRDDEAGDARKWKLWYSRLQKLKLSAPASGIWMRLMELAQRVEQLHQSLFRRQHAGKPPLLARADKGHLSWGLDTLVLSEAFFWAINRSRDDDAQLDVPCRDAAQAIWAFEAWRLFDDNDGDDRLPCQLGYDALDTLGRACGQCKNENARAYWQPVLSLGAKAEASISYFTGAFFARFMPDADSAQLAGVWRDMLAFVLADKGLTTGRHWYDGQKVLHGLLGFNSHALIARLPSAAEDIGAMRDLYADWAHRYLPSGESNLEAFAYFLTKPVTRHIRSDGIKWIAQALAGDVDRYLSRYERTGETLVELVESLLAEGMPDAPEERDAILTMTDFLVARRIPNALALQDRIRRSTSRA